MTNIRLTTSMIEDIKFCPFCGSALKGDNAFKSCGAHIKVYSGDPDEDDKLE